MNISAVRKIAKDERGQALVEFALIFTLLVILLFGIAEFGRGWYYANAMSNGARDGVRYASLQPKTCTRDNVRDYTFGNLTANGIKYNKLFFNMSAYRRNGSGFAVTGSFANFSTGTSAYAVMVIVKYQMDAITGNIVPFLGQTKMIARKATMRYEGN